MSVPQQQDGNDKVLTMFVDYANQQVTSARMSYLYELLQCLVEKEIISARSACEAVLDSVYLRLNDYPFVWHESFQFISLMLPQMDYKSVRAVFSILLCHVKAELPEKLMESQMPLLNDVKKVVNMGLDRSACLLPSYFVNFEIAKLYPDSEFNPHWMLGQMFADFVNSFKPLAEMVSISGHSLLFPIVGHSGSSNVWNLEPTTLKFPLKGPLPYQKPYNEPQKNLLRRVISQPYSKDIVISMLGLKKQQKQRCEALEELLVDLIIVGMEKTETNSNDESLQLIWQHLSSQFIFFILFQFASFQHMVLSLHAKLSEKNLQKGRNHLMWVLLQFISGSIQKRPLSTFAPVFKLFDLLFPEKEPIPVPSSITAENTNTFAMACIWIHFANKAKGENISVQSTPPVAITKHLEYLYQAIQQKQHDSNIYDVALLCNAYSTNPESFQPPLQELMGKCYGTMQNVVKLPGGPMSGRCTATGNTVPLEMKLLDTLTVHAKMSLIHSIVARIVLIAQAAKQQQQPMALAPALVETYSRLLVYMEIELFGMRVFITQLLPMALKNKAWGILHTLLEMLSYRLHHIQLHYRMNLLTHLHTVAMVTADKTQLPLCVQHTSLRLIMDFGNTDIQMQLSMQRIATDPEKMLSKDCEELNRVLIITIARAMQITSAEGLPFTWCEGVLKEAMNVSAHSKVQQWSASTLSFFPHSIQQFYQMNQTKTDPTGKLLMEKIEKHYRKIKSFGTDEELVINYCTDTEPALPEIFLCIMWKMMVENGRLLPICYQILMKLRSKALSNHLNVFSDFIVYEFKMFISGAQVSQQLSKRFQYLNELIWKYNVIQLDRLILSLALRPHEEKNSQICFYIVKILLLQRNEFKTRVKAFVSENSPQHWRQTDWYDKHIAYHEKFPERYYFEGILESNNQPLQTPEYLPTYFGNVCLRFVPVLDILLHRLLELPPPQGSPVIEAILNEYGMLFKFHDRPITYLYNTLHYFQKKLSDDGKMKKKIASVIISSQKDNYPDGWACSPEFMDYLNGPSETWSMSYQYLDSLITRLTLILTNKQSPKFITNDWRFNEFPNPSAHALYVVCVELMTLPVSANDIGNSLIDVMTKTMSSLNSFERSSTIVEYINSISLVMASLPDAYLQVINQKIIDILKNQFSSVNLTPTSSLPTFFDFLTNYAMKCENYADYIMTLFHATWLHTSVGRFTQLSSFLRDELKPLITNEMQLLYVFCIYGPFLQRFHQERSRKKDGLFEISGEFYYILEQVCRNTTFLVFNDVICDFLYHLKYMFVGDNLRDVLLKTLPHLHPPLQNILKFMVAPPTIKKEAMEQQQSQQQVSQGQQQQDMQQVMEVINLTNQ